MVSQAVYVGDCELLEFHMDALDASNSRWKTCTNRTIIEGLAVSITLPNAYTGGVPGLAECISGWRGLAPLVLNSRYGGVSNMQNFEPLSAVAGTEWPHFADVVNIAGVQDGLPAVPSGQITPAEFLKLNAVVDGWKPQPAMVQEACPFYPSPGCNPNSGFSNWDPWSQRNQAYSANGTPAPRSAGDVLAMQALYRVGLVFRGNIDLPIIDWRN